jgi:hypothetical protein
VNDPTKKRLTICFTVELDLAAADSVAQALTNPVRREWLRNRLETALEQFAAWVTGCAAWRARVISGSVHREPEELDR